MESENSMGGDSPPTQETTASTLRYMHAAKRWLLWRAEADSDPTKKPRKVPYYVNGTKRGVTDTDEDRASLTSYQEACAVFAQGGYDGLAFALGPDGAGGCWQGIDLDDIPDGQLDQWAALLPGYVEVSPSGKGLHAIGYGAYFAPLGSNGTGFEAYASGRYFTFTAAVKRDGALVCLSSWVQGPVAARHSARGSTASVAGDGAIWVDPKTVSELRSALNAIPADEYHVWIRMGCALCELVEGRELWLSWSQQSSRWKPADAKKWDTFRSDRTGYQAVFAEAQRHGWINPASNAAQVQQTTPPIGFGFRFAKAGVTVVQIDYLIDPWLPRATVIGVYGRGEAGKSSWVAQACAVASRSVSALWITSEERQDHILARHIACGGEENTLAVNVALPTEIDPATKKPVATSFNAYEHLEPAIEAFKREAEARADRPLGIVALDAVVALTKWPKGVNANDDEGVKKFLAFLIGVAERYDVIIFILGHLNKRTTSEHAADSVTGAAAWTNSLRLAYMFKKDPDADFQGLVRTVKNNTGQHYGATYRTVPRYLLRERPDGKSQYLCGVEMDEVLWGELALREALADENDEFLNRIDEKREKVATIVEQAMRALRSGSTTRKAVEAFIGFGMKVNRRHWQEADKILAQRGVQMQNDVHNTRIYWLPDQTRK